MRILYIDVDALRADHLGCYGYHRDTTPTIDRLAAEGVRHVAAGHTALAEVARVIDLTNGL
jgi:arylsulfatase A-like enzyme